MANEQNLIPTNKRTKSEARELGRKGGIASGEARRRKKTCREIFAMLRGMDIKDEKIIQSMRKAGLEDDDYTYGGALALQTMMKAMKDPRWARLAYEMMGENEAQGNTIVNNNLPPQINVHFVGDDEDGH